MALTHEEPLPGYRVSPWAVEFHALPLPLVPDPYDEGASDGSVKAWCAEVATPQVADEALVQVRGHRRGDMDVWG